MSVDRVSTTESRSQWYTTDDIKLIPTVESSSFNDTQLLRIQCGLPSTDWDFDADDDILYKGQQGVPLDYRYINNPYGNVADDFKWVTNLACWMKSDSWVYAANPDAWVMFIGKELGGADYVKVVCSQILAVNRWYWVDNTALAGKTFALNGDDIEFFGFGPDASADVASTNFYVNTFVAYRSTLGAITNTFDWKYAIQMKITSMEETDSGHYSIKGLLMGSYILEQEMQLRSMVTQGLSTHDILARPFPKFQALPNNDIVKTYLLSVDNTYKSTTRKMIRMPIVISSVTTSMTAGRSGPVCYFSIDAYRFSGV